MKFTFNINIEKKHVLGLFLIFGIVMIGFVIAIDSSVPRWVTPSDGVWHDANNVKVKIGGEYFSLQTAIDSGLLGQGSGETTVVNVGTILQTINVPGASDTDYTLNCGSCKKPMNNDQCCIGGIVGPLGNNCIGGTVEPINRAKYSTYNANISLNESVVVGTDKFYEFSCTYGGVSSTQTHTVQLNESDQVIAEFEEPHMLNWGGMLLCGKQEFAVEKDKYTYNAFVNSDGKMVVKVKRVDSCNSVTVNSQGQECEWSYTNPVNGVRLTCTPGTTGCIRHCTTVDTPHTEIRCLTSTECPAYIPDTSASSSGWCKKDLYSPWKSVRCNIRAA